MKRYIKDTSVLASLTTADLSDYSIFDLLSIKSKFTQSNGNYGHFRNYEELLAFSRILDRLEDEGYEV